MLADQIKEKRKQQNMTQTELAAQLNVTQGAVAQWENGLTTPTIEMLIRVVVYDPPRLKDARQKFTALLLAHKGRIPASDYCLPLEGPIRLVTKWLFPIPEGSGHLDGEWKITKPDTDNSLKMFKDCITRTGWWVDDAQVCSEITEKFWGARPGIYVCIERISQSDDY